MFQCNECHRDCGCFHVTRSTGKCENCGSVADCYDCHLAPRMSFEDRQETVRWFLSRPRRVQKAALLIPPASKVKAVPGKSLVCPAPGVIGYVISYVENKDGTVSVRVTDGTWGAVCELDWLEVVEIDVEVASLLQNASLFSGVD